MYYIFYIYTVRIVAVGYMDDAVRWDEKGGDKWSAINYLYTTYKVAAEATALRYLENKRD